MMTDNGGQAYPTTDLYVDGNSCTGGDCDSGMTLLDYFAGQVMTKLIFLRRDEESVDWSNRHIATESYKIAATMIVEKRRLEPQ